MSRQDEPNNADFQTQEYWDKRYAAEQPDEDFDWFKTYEELKPIFDELIGDRNKRVLMLGCGNSTLTADMVADGYVNITNLDYSGIVIEKMRARHPTQDWRVMDVRRLNENADSLGGLGSWDVIIDKGTMDALMAEKGSVWDPSDTVRRNVESEIYGVLSLLKSKTGIFLYLTWMQPHFRKPYMERDAWMIETRTLGDAFHYFLYIARKH